MDSKNINFDKINETLQSIKCNDHQGQKIVSITGQQRQRVQLFKLFCSTCKSTSQEQEVICDFPEQLIQMLKQQGERIEKEEQQKANVQVTVEDNRNQFEAIKQKIEEVQSFLKTLKQFVEQRLNEQSQTQEKPNLKDIYYRKLKQIESCSTKSELQDVMKDIASLNYPSEREFQISFENLLNNKQGPIKGASNEGESENYQIISKINSILSPLLKIADNHEHYERKSNDFGKFLINLKEETNQISDQLNSLREDTTFSLLEVNNPKIIDFKEEYRGQITQILKKYLEYQANIMCSAHPEIQPYWIHINLVKNQGSSIQLEIVNYNQKNKCAFKQQFQNQAYWNFFNKGIGIYQQKESHQRYDKCSCNSNLKELFTTLQQFIN